MSPDNPDLAVVVTTAAFGAASAGVLAIPKQMPRNEVIYRVAIASILGATVPQVLMHYTGLHQVVTWLLGVVCGVSAPEIVMQVQAFTKDYLKKKREAILGAEAPPTQGGTK